MVQIKLFGYFIAILINWLFIRLIDQLVHFWCCLEGVMAGAKAAVVATVATAIPTVSFKQKFCFSFPLFYFLLSNYRSILISSIIYN